MLQDSLTATPERIAKAGETYLAPKKGQKENRSAGRVQSQLDLLERKSLITARQAEAGRALEFYFHAHERYSQPQIASYGDQRWESVTEGQTDTTRLTGIDWSIYALQRLDEAREFIDNPNQWTALMYTFRGWNTEQIGAALGHMSRRSKIRHGKRHLNDALNRLQRFYGYE